MCMCVVEHSTPEAESNACLHTYIHVYINMCDDVYMYFDVYVYMYTQV